MPARTKQRKIALLLGMTRYSTGIPCKKGHVAERMVNGGNCVECLRIRAKTPLVRAKRRADSRRAYERNPEKIRANSAKWQRAYSSYYQAKRAEREIAKVQRMPAWADKEAIKFFYECRPKGYHVDHIIPLRGKSVSGLHVETNLQWLPASVNVSKGNRYEARADAERN